MTPRPLPDWCADCPPDCLDGQFQGNSEADDQRERDRLDREPPRRWDAEGHEIGEEKADGEGDDDS